MKTNIKTMMMALMAMMSFALISCDDDEYIARTLEGTWEGDMYVSYYYDVYDTYYDASYSEICFLRDPYRYAQGNGYWIDYYNDYSRYGWSRNYVANHIEWEVYNGNIRVYFVEDNSYVTIYNYALDNDYFTGYIDLYDGNRQRFNLRHISSPNWNSYYWGYDDFYYYSNKNKMDVEDDALNANKSVMDLEEGNANTSEATKTPVKPKRIFRARE